MTDGSCGAPRKVLAVVDTGDTQIALQSAVALAGAHGAALEIMACVEPPHDMAILARLSGEPPERLLEEAVERTRKDLIARLSALLPEMNIKPTVAVGKAYLEIIRHVASSGCDFVVKTAEPLPAVQRFLFSSTDQHLLRKCPCPVWLQTATAHVRPRRILAAVDLDTVDADEPGTLSWLNRRVVEAACRVADASDSEIVVLHAWEALGEGLVWAFSGSGDTRLSADRYVNEIIEARHREMDSFLGQLREKGGAQPQLVPRLARGAPEVVIQEQCDAVSADLVVMGTVARTGLSGVFIGNTAENIINSLECPVLAVKPDGFISPLLTN